MKIASTFFWIAATSVLALPGCTPPPPPDTTPPPRALPHRDGVYAGTLTSVSGGPGCRFDATVSYEASGSHIWLRTHRQRRYLDGQIAPDGSLVMLSKDDTHRIAGSISGDRLTALDTTLPHHARHSGGQGFAEEPCQARVEAHFVVMPPAPEAEQ